MEKLYGIDFSNIGLSIMNIKHEKNEYSCNILPVLRALCVPTKDCTNLGPAVVMAVLPEYRDVREVTEAARPMKRNPRCKI